MKKPSAFIGKIFDEILNQGKPLGDKLKETVKSYYGFVPEKGKFGPFSAPFLTPALLAKSLMVSKKTLERWRIAGGGPPFIMVSKQVRYPIVELDNWVRASLINRE